MKWKNHLIVLLLFTALTEGYAQGVEVVGKVDTMDILIGDQFRLDIQIAYPREGQLVEVDLSALGAEGSPFEIIRMQQVDTVARSSQWLLQQSLVLTSFDSGRHYLPVIPVRVMLGGTLQTGSTNEIPIMVRTIPVNADSTSLQPIKDIMREPLRFGDVLPYLLAAAGLAALVLTIVYLIRKPRGERGAPPAPVIVRPAHEIALEKLDRLRRSDILLAQGPKAFQSELTFILREYLENRYRIPALESTSEEIVRDLYGTDLGEEWWEALRRMLQTADLVKFAKAEPPVTFHLDALETVQDFVDKTKAVVEEPAATASGQTEEKNSEP